MIEKEGLNLRFSRTHRASIERVSNIEILLPDFDKQNELINQINKIETEIFELENNLDKLNEEKENILIKILEIKYD